MSITAPGFAEGFVKTAIDKFGALDIIVNNAGYTWDNVVQKMTWSRTRLTQPTTKEKTVHVEGRDVKVGVHPDRIEQAKRDIPRAAPGIAEEAAGSIFMFCIPESNYVTGQTLICGGGRGGF